MVCKKYLSACFACWLRGLPAAGAAAPGAAATATGAAAAADASTPKVVSISDTYTCPQNSWQQFIPFHCSCGLYRKDVHAYLQGPNERGGVTAHTKVSAFPSTTHTHTIPTPTTHARFCPSVYTHQLAGLQQGQGLELVNLWVGTREGGVESRRGHMQAQTYDWLKHRRPRRAVARIYIRPPSPGIRNHGTGCVLCATGKSCSRQKGDATPSLHSKARKTRGLFQ
jgi:hypothetical protein